MGQLKHFPILQVVGYKNSGKTTLVQKLISELVKNKLKYGVLKHHGHGGLPVIHDEGTDTWKYRESGASTTAVEGSGLFQFSSNIIEKMPIEKMISLFQLFPLDGVVIEGFKQANYPKIVLIRSDDELILLENTTNVIAIIYWNEKLREYSQYQIPHFLISEEKEYLTYIVDWLKEACK